MQSSADIRALDHGFFQFPRPTTRHVVGYVIASGLFLVAFGLYTSSLSIPDVPRVEEAELLSSLHDDPGEYDYGELQKGYKQGDYAQTAAFVVIPLELEQGLLGQDESNGLRTMRATVTGSIPSGWQTHEHGHVRCRGPANFGRFRFGRLVEPGRRSDRRIVPHRGRET